MIDIFAVLCGLGGAVLITYQLMSGMGAQVLFAWHPTLMSIGFLFFMTSGLVAYRSPYLQTSRTAARTAHIVLQVLGSLTVFAGLIIIIVNKLSLSPPHSHFQSAHSIMGLIAVVLVFVQFCTGLFKASMVPQKYLKWHGDVGHLGYVFGIAALILGLCNFFSSWKVPLQVLAVALPTLALGSVHHMYRTGGGNDKEAQYLLGGA